MKKREEKLVSFKTLFFFVHPIPAKIIAALRRREIKDQFRDEGELYRPTWVYNESTNRIRS